MLESGLSPMQEQLLHSEKFVRLVSAPTGSGKSYVFVRAAVREGNRILFIVPTKRLLQNLSDSASEQARHELRQRGWREDRIEKWISKSIVNWDANQSFEEGRQRYPTRLEQLVSPQVSLLFAIPEVVVSMISGGWVKGGTSVNPFTYPRSFDHIVFDEFHTISDRSFGLACLLGLLAVSERQGKVSLLSATPINVINILKRVGISENDIESITENIVAGHPDGSRPIHGDVTIQIRDCTLLESLKEESIVPAVEKSISEGYTVLFIYDSLQRLKQQEPTLRSLLTRFGISDEKILTINSIDDSARKLGDSPRGRKYADPRNYSVLICTSSVEIGVSFRSTLLLMEPGHSTLSFVQRIGRVSRGKENGMVVVSCPKDRRNRNRWIKHVVSVIERNKELDIQTFTAKILSDVRRKLEPASNLKSNSASLEFYRKASWRGAFWAGLFIKAVLLEKMSVQKEARKRLGQLQGNTFRKISFMIDRIKSVDMVDDNIPRKMQPHKEWLSALLNSALTYRDIGSTITVIDPDGTQRTVPEGFLRRATSILRRYIQHEKDGEMVVRLQSKTLDQEIQNYSGNTKEQRLQLYVRSPIGGPGFSVSIREHDWHGEIISRRLVEEWKKNFAHLIPKSRKHEASPRENVMQAATELIEMLGRPPLEEDYEDSEQSTFFA